MDIGGWNQEILSLEEPVEITQMMRRIAISTGDGDPAVERAF